MEESKKTNMCSPLSDYIETTVANITLSWCVPVTSQRAKVSALENYQGMSTALLAGPHQLIKVKHYEWVNV